MHTALRLLQIEREQAKLGRRPDGEEVPWEQRAVGEVAFQQHQHDLPKNGLRARISLFIGGNNMYPNNALIGLKVEPLEPIMTYRAPYKGTPWHISIGFSNDDGSLSNEAIAFIHKFSEPKTIHLRINNVGWNAVTFLAANDSLVTDPVVIAFHQSSYYKHTDLHITF